MGLKVLISGATGFVGQHLVNLMSSSEYTIYGTSFPEKPKKDDKDFFYLDIKSQEDVSEAIKKTKPDWIFHLAAISNVRHSWERKKETLETNLMGTLFLFEAVKAFAPEARILYISSSDVYGILPQVEKKLKEDQTFRVINPYAFTKVSGEILSHFYSEIENLDVVIARSFPHTGPGQSSDFVCSDWAYQVVRVEKGLQEPVVRVGSIKVKRDFTDVRDVVRAYLFLMEKGKSGEAYNVCSGKAVSLEQVLDTLLSYSSSKIESRIDPKKFRKADIPFLVGDNTKIKEETSWKPKIQIEQTLFDLIEYWRRII